MNTRIIITTALLIAVFALVAAPTYVQASSPQFDAGSAPYEPDPDCDDYVLDGTDLDDIPLVGDYFRNNTIQGFAGNDEIYGGACNDLIIAGPGIDTIEGGHGNDVLRGGENTDYLYGGPGDDILVGGPGDDHFYGGDGHDICFAKQGIDTIHSGCEVVIN